MKAKTGATVNQTLASVLWRSDSGVYRVLWELLRLTFWCFWSVALLCFSVPDRKLLSWWFNATWERISWCRQQQVEDRCRWCVTLSQAFISAVLTEDEQWPHSLGSAACFKRVQRSPPWVKTGQHESTVWLPSTAPQHLSCRRLSENNYIKIKSFTWFNRPISN